MDRTGYKHETLTRNAKNTILLGKPEENSTADRPRHIRKCINNTNFK